MTDCGDGAGFVGDFYFIPVYFLGNVHLYQHKDKCDIYAIYQQGVTYHKGSEPYNSGNLEDGNYLGYGIGVKLFSDFHIELMIKNYSADNSNFEHEYEITDAQDKIIDGSDHYDLSTDYQSISVGFGISNLFDDFLNHLY